MKKIHDFDEVQDSQKMFRLILKAMANPLKVVNIKEQATKLFGEHKDFLAVAMTLLDNEVSFNTCEHRKLSEDIVSLTLAKREIVSKADYIFVAKPSSLPEVIANAKGGTLRDPHNSATVIVKISPEQTTKITMSGAGINRQISIHTDKIVLEAINNRDSRFFEYPEGLDFIFLDEQFNLFAIPRLTKKEVFA